jgi:hypothetical protein
MNRINFSLIILVTGLSLLLFACQQVSEQESAVQTTTESPDPYLAKGKKIASSVFTVLSTEVMKSMQASGVAGTVAYCNEQAYPITDSLAKLYQAHIKRTSHKVRNPRNAPDSLEAIMLEKYLTLQQKGLEMPPRVVQQGENVHFFAPIVLATPCLKCHGIVGETLNENDLAVIQEHYSEDKATGFADGELRGIWSIRF